MLYIEPYTTDKLSQIRELAVSPPQQQFTVVDIEQRIASNPSSQHPFLLVRDNLVLGFFILDTKFGSDNSFSPNTALGIRALLVDKRYQGQGIATQALKQLPDYVRKHYQGFCSIYLTVNCRNKAAYQCYLGCDFQDSGELYLGGPVGPQHILHYTL